MKKILGIIAIVAFSQGCAIMHYETFDGRPGSPELDAYADSVCGPDWNPMCKFEAKCEVMERLKTGSMCDKDAPQPPDMLDASEFESPTANIK